jgi:hypothetical protein
MRQLVACFGLSALLLTNVFADGYLWLSGAGELPARIFRYNLRTGQVDRVVSRQVGLRAVARLQPAGV